MNHIIFLSKTKKLLLFFIIPTKNVMGLQTAKLVPNPVQQAKANI